VVAHETRPAVRQHPEKEVPGVLAIEIELVAELST
jgi:hypothetical protein